ncbi:DUF3443 family protein [Ramlibacter algicola]|uniref:DUF3443 family protein n=1 Tax=Ramlibacter algicola TaxID=2795217 RepID=A0A934PZP6_9BURK|nr:DUF3443 family protein [Ramlibacter algicola]MBK0391997.1 DUF3443 family protein [Ramlibacter algicola]
MKRLLRVGVSIACALVLAACGGGGGGGSATKTVEPVFAGVAPLSAPTNAPTGFGPTPTAAANVLPVVVDRGIRGTAFNAPFVTVTVCVPGGTCADIDHVIVDTASAGLRLNASALPATLALPEAATTDGSAAAQCMKFLGGFTWGSVRRADVQLAGQRIASMPVHVMADTDARFATIPSGCSSAGANLANRLDAKGILGVGMSRQDCGSSCVTSAAPAMYYGCGASGCAPATVPLASQVTNPVTLLAAHNNGVALMLQQVPQGGAATVGGALVLGIGTDANNQLGSARLLAPDRSGQVSVTLKGRSLPAYIDSGSNALLFPDTELPKCGELFCPAQPTALDVRLRSPAGVEQAMSFTVESAPTWGAAAATIAAPWENETLWGLPFFFGRTVFVAIKDAPTPAGNGPFWAF